MAELIAVFTIILGGAIVLVGVAAEVAVYVLAAWLVWEIIKDIRNGQ